ncbi:MauE/DoxX family redox-associated membrane protein [Mucilaginibacter terrae]|uniref:Oxidoreductase n=1 Tax=Mucilaginibacter terrae TaxID=1955052 RepID=A0ABU3GWV8_9SPHI|nr:MauE/DoxX family redox-associated membrane protein [Mucilaginibacter terrae]MDT3404251.1 putative oxidoreductase [Mucilaginibacter terrae]
MQLPIKLTKESRPITGIAAALLVALFVYTALSKWFAFQEFKVQMRVQAVPGWAADFLTWTLPTTELIVALLLITYKWRLIGFWLSLALMTSFTGYIMLVLVGYFGRVPCSCGGVLKSMGWQTHLFFNLFFLLLSILGIYLVNRERRMIGTV